MLDNLCLFDMQSSIGLGFGLHSGVHQQQQAGWSRRNGGLLLCSRKRRSRFLVVAKKQQWDAEWVPREVTLDEADMVQLRMRRALGEPQDVSLAKVVAKKLNPLATNLEVEKYVKQKGVKPFLELIKSEPKVPAPPPRSTASAPKPTTRKDDILLDSNLRAPPRRPGMPSNYPPRGPRYISKEQEDDEIAIQRIRRLLDDEELESLQRPFPTPKSIAQKASMPVPELKSRPSRGGAMEAFPVMKTPTPAPKKDLPIPSLITRPQVRIPISEDTESEVSIEENVQDTTVKQDSSGNGSTLPSLTTRPQIRMPEEAELIDSGEVPSVSEDVSRDLPLPSLSSRPRIPAPAFEGTRLESSKQNVAATIKQDAMENDLSLPNLSSRPQIHITASGNKESNEKLADDHIAREEEQSQKMMQDRDIAMSLQKPGKRSPEGINVENIDGISGQSPSQAKVPLMDAVQAVSNAETLRRPIRITQEAEARETHGPQRYISQEEIDRDWALAEAAMDTKTIQDVVFVGSNAGGMIVRFGCLNGFLPGKDLLDSRGLKTFRSWARERGQIVNHTSVMDTSESSELTYASSETNNTGLKEASESHSMHPECEGDLEKVYREQRIAFLSSLIGQRAKVMVTHVDKIKKKLVFSERKALLEDPAVVQRRAELMAKLKIGDIVKGKVRNISLFGVFLELVEGVSGLIHFSELSWTPLSDPAKLMKIGEELEAMVYKLDQDRQRIYLSVKRMSPDPLLESVESMLAKGELDSNSRDSDALKIPELEALLTKLEARDEVQQVVTTRRLTSTAVAPSFQVYLSSKLPEGYKLLARLENEVQEVLVQTSLERDVLKSIILASTTTTVGDDIL